MNNLLFFGSLHFIKGSQTLATYLYRPSVPVPDPFTSIFHSMLCQKQQGSSLCLLTNNVPLTFWDPRGLKLLIFCYRLHICGMDIPKASAVEEISHTVASFLTDIKDFGSLTHAG